MRKVTFNTLKYDHATRKHVWKDGWFHGFFLTCFHDGESNVNYTAAFIEDPETGEINEVATANFKFLDKAAIEAPELNF